MTSKRHAVTLIPGDGIGPEVTLAARRVVEATGVLIDWDVQHAGAAVFRAGDPTGVPAATVESIRRTRVVLKGPLETPVGFGEKSANVTLRKLFETFGNVRPVRELPGVVTPFSGRGIDLVVVRENVEDLYAGIEHQQTPSVAQALKIMSRLGCEKVVRLGFEVARAEGRKTVHCATKANILKLTEGLLKRTFEEVATEYPDIEAKHILVDNAAHQLVRAPEQFEVIITSNMNGDILSDLTSGLIGGLGFAPGANLGADVAIFEAVHGTAPAIAGQDLANPSAELLTAVMMLRHLGELEAARAIEAGIDAALADGIFTCDVHRVGASGTRAFADAVIARLKRPSTRPSRLSKPIDVSRATPKARPEPTDRVLMGVDLFIESREKPDTVGRALEEVCQRMPLQLKMLSNRGAQVYPSTGAMPDLVDQYRCRFVGRAGTVVTDEHLLALAAGAGKHFRWMHLEKLEQVDGVTGWTKAQGEGA
jgi:isocitrate dehydrogenase